MVWGAARGIDDLVARVKANDAALHSLYLMRTRTFCLRDALALCDALKGNSVLGELSISSHAVTPEMAAAFAEVLRANTPLASLSLGNFQFGDQGLAALCSGLKDNSTLRKLDLEGKGITEVGCVSLAEALQGSCLLHELVLANNAIGAAGAATLCPGLPALRVLDLRGCGLSGAAAGEAIATLLSSGSLRVLRLEENELGPEAAETLAPALLNCRTLAELHVRGCSLGPGGVEVLSRHLPDGLHHLDASGTGAGRVGFTQLGAALAANATPVLRYLALCNAGGDARAVANVAKGLSGPSRPEGSLSLDLGGNAADPEALAALARCRVLRSLCLHDCKIGSAGAVALSNLLLGGGFAALQELDLSANGIEADALCGLLRGLLAAAPAGLELFVIAANPGIDCDGLDEAVAALQEVRPQLHIVRMAVDRGGQGMPPSR